MIVQSGITSFISHDRKRKRSPSPKDRIEIPSIRLSTPATDPRRIPWSTSRHCRTSPAKKRSHPRERKPPVSYSRRPPRYALARGHTAALRKAHAAGSGRNGKLPSPCSAVSGPVREVCNRARNWGSKWMYGCGRQHGLQETNQISFDAILDFVERETYHDPARQSRPPCRAYWRIEAATRERRASCGEDLQPSSRTFFLTNFAFSSRIETNTRSRLIGPDTLFLEKSH